MRRAGAVLLMLVGLAGCAWGIDKANSDSVTLTHYGDSGGEVTERAERWCSRFSRQAQVVSTERVDNSGVYFRTTFRCLAG